MAELGKQRAALLSIVSNTALVILKGTTGFLTGSVSILSEALNSATDIVASVMAYLSIRQAERPADREHPFGHGKFENLSGVVESGIIVSAALLIMYKAVKRVLYGETLSMPLLGVSVMGLSAVVKYIVSYVLYSVARRTDSIALEAEAKNLRMDVYSNLSVLGGLLIVSLTGYYFIDSLLAFGVSALIISEGFSIARRSIQSLLDISLPARELKIIHEVLDAHRDLIRDYHELRTRKAGSERHIDLHLTVCAEERIQDTHRTMDSIEHELAEKLPGAKVIIHPEPCPYTSEACPSECYLMSITEREREGTENRGVT